MVDMQIGGKLPFKKKEKVIEQHDDHEHIVYKDPEKTEQKQKKVIRLGGKAQPVSVYSFNSDKQSLGSNIGILNLKSTFFL